MTSSNCCVQWVALIIIIIIIVGLGRTRQANCGAFQIIEEVPSAAKQKAADQKAESDAVRYHVTPHPTPKELLADPWTVADAPAAEKAVGKGAGKAAGKGASPASVGGPAPPPRAGVPHPSRPLVAVYAFAGRWLAKALLDGHTVQLRLAKPLYSALLARGRFKHSTAAKAASSASSSASSGGPGGGKGGEGGGEGEGVSREELGLVDGALWRHLALLEELPPAEVEGLALDFSVTYDKAPWHKLASALQSKPGQSGGEAFQAAARSAMVTVPLVPEAERATQATDSTEAESWALAGSWRQEALALINRAVTPPLPPPLPPPREVGPKFEAV